MDNNSVETYIKPYQFSAFADYIIQTHPSYEEWNANNYINLYGIDNGSHVVDYCTGSVFGLLPLLTVINRADEIDNDKGITVTTDVLNSVLISSASFNASSFDTPE